MEQWMRGPVRSHLLPCCGPLSRPITTMALHVRHTGHISSVLAFSVLPLVCAVHPGLEFSLSRRISLDPGDGLLSSQSPTVLVFGEATWVSSERQGSQSWALV